MYCDWARICFVKCSEVSEELTRNPWLKGSLSPGVLPWDLSAPSFSNGRGWEGGGRTKIELKCSSLLQISANSPPPAAAAALLLISFLLGFPRV